MSKNRWVLAVALNEDRDRVRKDQSPENLAFLATLTHLEF